MPVCLSVLLHAESAVVAVCGDDGAVVFLCGTVSSDSGMADASSAAFSGRTCRARGVFAGDCGRKYVDDIDRAEAVLQLHFLFLPVCGAVCISLERRLAVEVGDSPLLCDRCGGVLCAGVPGKPVASG